MNDDRIPDPIERGEARAEDAYLEARRGCEPGTYRCPGCGEIRPEADALPASPDPYSDAVCGSCIEEAYPGAFDGVDDGDA